jgi:TDG/mug DNA glycosylase family protein
MGERVTTLEDLLRPGLRAVCIGINPSVVSVEVGHYYQGRLGKRFLGRLRQAGVLPPDAEPGREDDAAFAAGIGFTDVVKRPTPRAHGLRPGELEHGAARLVPKLEEARPALLVFTYKQAADAVLPALRESAALRSTSTFRMPGPYAPAAEVASGLDDLRRALGV